MQFVTAVFLLFTCVFPSFVVANDVDDDVVSTPLYNHAPFTIKKHRRLDKAAKSMSKPVVISDSWARLTSPAKGTDITKNPIDLIKCHNQSSCIMPELQLREKYKVYYCARTSYGVRFYYLVREGLLLHPNIQLVQNIDEADVIVYLPVSSPWEKSECGHEKYYSKLLVLDEGDGPHIFDPDNAPKQWNILYFKRSYVRRHDGKFNGYMGYLEAKPRVLPMTYIIAEAYIKPDFNTIKSRDYDIVCTLRGSKQDPTRMRVREWVEEYAKARGVQKYMAGQVRIYYDAILRLPSKHEMKS